MRVTASLRAELERLILDLVARRYADIAADGRIGRLTQNELESAVRRYGRTLTVLPEDAWRVVNVYPHERNGAVSVDIDLWTIEEGRSDLTLCVTATPRGDDYSVEIDDLHVL